MTTAGFRTLQDWFRYFYGKSRFFAPWADPVRARQYSYRRARFVILKRHGYFPPETLSLPAMLPETTREACESKYGLCA